MKKIKLATSILVSSLFIPSTGFTQGLMKDEVITVSDSTYNWTGFYAGFNAGIVNHTMNITDTDGASFLSTIQQVSNLNFTGGFQVGYRRELDLANKVAGVYGLEMSTHFSNAEFKKEYGSPFALYQLSSEHTLKTVCLLELMGGIAANRTLLFMTGGLSWVNITGSTTNLDSIPFFNSFSVNKQEFGTVIGGGLEYAFTDRMSARFKVDVITPNTYSTTDNTGNSYQISNNIVQAILGINYKFS